LSGDTGALTLSLAVRTMMHLDLASVLNLIATIALVAAFIFTASP
jgi:hypothetical protein